MVVILADIGYKLTRAKSIFATPTPSYNPFPEKILAQFDTIIARAFIPLGRLPLFHVVVDHFLLVKVLAFCILHYGFEVNAIS